MRLVIVRHAKAASGSPDELRPLTPEGLEQARALGRRLREELGSVDAVLASPLLRACQTATELGLGEPEPDERLAPGATAAGVREAVQDRGETVVVVGHQPDCSELALELGGVDTGFPPAGSCVIEL